VHCEPLARAGARLLWGYDIGRAWALIGETAAAAPGAAVLDAPSGGGIALRGIRHGQHVRYVAADISAVMLARAGRRALDPRKAPASPPAHLHLVQADVASLPLRDGTFDLCLSYNGLHCLPRPAVAIAEYARVLRPGGILRGTTVVAGTSRWHDAVTWALRAARVFGPPIRADDLRAWLGEAGLRDVSVRCRGAVAEFTAHAPAPPGGG
jgi:SAM-dependent methyltransferase